MDTLAQIKTIKFNGHKIELSENIKAKPVAKLSKFITVGKNKGQYKLLEGYYFQTEERRQEWIKKAIQTIKDRLNEKTQKQQRKNEIRSNFINPFKVDEIYYDSWGYDQTNIDFYLITQVKQKSVMLQKIGGKMVAGTQGMDCSNVAPNPDCKIGEPYLKPVVFYLDKENNPVYHLTSRHGWISLYDRGDKGVYSSWYA